MAIDFLRTELILLYYLYFTTTSITMRLFTKHLYEYFDNKTQPYGMLGNYKCNKGDIY